MTTEEALSWLRSRRDHSPYAAECVDHLVAELGRLGLIEEKVRDEVDMYGGRDYAHDTYSQAKLDFAREVLGLV